MTWGHGCQGRLRAYRPFKGGRAGGNDVAITEEAGAVSMAAVRGDGELRPPASVKFFYSMG